MTYDITDLLIKIVGDIPDRLNLVLTKLSPEPETNPTLLNPPTVLVSLPIRVSLVRRPDNKILASAETKKPFTFTPHEAQTIETYASHQHLPKEDGLKELINLSLQDHELLKEASIKTLRKPSTQTHVQILVELWNTISWDEKHTDSTAE